MQLWLFAAAWLAAAAMNVAAAETAPATISDPKVNGQPVDRCADIDAQNDCSARGEAKAAAHVCMENGYKDQTGSHWRAASGTAEHFVTEYDMHQGEVGGRWVAAPTQGVFDRVVCQK